MCGRDRKGEGLESGQLFQNALYVRERNANIHPFDLRRLGEAFRIRETTPVHLPSVEKGIRTSVVKINSELEDKGRKHKKHKDQDKGHKMCRNRHMDNNGDADKSKSVTNGLKIVQFKEQPDMLIQKRRLDGSEDLSVHERKRVRIPG